MGRVTDMTSSAAEPAENERDESDILANQDETDSGDVNADDEIMGAGPTDLDVASEELDVKEQMDRASRKRP